VSKATAPPEAEPKHLRRTRHLLAEARGHPTKRALKLIDGGLAYLFLRRAFGSMDDDEPEPVQSGV
jgi:hypothetical protein